MNDSPPSSPFEVEILLAAQQRQRRRERMIGRRRRMAWDDVQRMFPVVDEEDSAAPVQAQLAPSIADRRPSESTTRPGQLPLWMTTDDQGDNQVAEPSSAATIPTTSGHQAAMMTTGSQAADDGSGPKVTDDKVVELSAADQDPQEDIGHQEAAHAQTAPLPTASQVAEMSTADKGIQVATNTNVVQTSVAIQTEVDESNLQSLEEKLKQTEEQLQHLLHACQTVTGATTFTSAKDAAKMLLDSWEARERKEEKMRIKMKLIIKEKKSNDSQLKEIVDAAKEFKRDVLNMAAEEEIEDGSVMEETTAENAVEHLRDAWTRKCLQYDQERARFMDRMKVLAAPIRDIVGMRHRCSYKKLARQLTTTWNKARQEKGELEEKLQGSEEEVERLKEEAKIILSRIKVSGEEIDRLKSESEAMSAKIKEFMGIAQEITGRSSDGITPENVVIDLREAWTEVKCKFDRAKQLCKQEMDRYLNKFWEANTRIKDLETEIEMLKASTAAAETSKKKVTRRRGCFNILMCCRNIRDFRLPGPDPYAY